MIQITPVVNSDIETLRKETISVAGEIDTYTFTANAGTLIYFDGQQGDFNFYARLNNPDGTRVSTSTLYTGRDYGAYLLAQSGEYTLEVQGSGSSTTGDYRFKLIDLKASSALNLNTPEDVLLNPLETKVFKFTGITGQKIWFDGLNTSYPNVTARLFNSSGRQITSNSDLRFDIGLQTLEADGEYYLVLQSNNSAATTAQFQLLDNLNATTVSLDTEIRGDFGESKREAHLYRFSGTEGQRLYFDQIEGDFRNYYYLYNPAGQRLFFERLDRDYEGVTLPTDGEYILVFQSINSASNNNYALKIVTPEFITEPLTLGQTIRREISEPGEQDTYPSSAP